MCHPSKISENVWTLNSTCSNFSLHYDAYITINGAALRSTKSLIKGVIEKIDFLYIAITLSVLLSMINSANLT